MTYKEFATWLTGYMAATNGTLTVAQCNDIREELSKLDEDYNYPPIIFPSEQEKRRNPYPTPDIYCTYDKNSKEAITGSM